MLEGLSGLSGLSGIVTPLSSGPTGSYIIQETTFKILQEDGIGGILV